MAPGPKRSFPISEGESRGDGRISPSMSLKLTLKRYGCFRRYLYKMRRSLNPTCQYCCHPEYTAEHTVFHCPYWKDFRRAVKAYVGGRSIAPTDVLDLLCGSADIPIRDVHRYTQVSSSLRGAPSCFYNMVEDILHRKVQDDRMADAGTNATLKVAR